MHGARRYIVGTLVRFGHKSEKGFLVGTPRRIEVIIIILGGKIEKKKHSPRSERGEAIGTANLPYM